MNTLSNPESTLGLLENFVGHFDQAAVAHAREELTAEERTSITAFARGQLDDAARKQLIPLLAHNTTALEYLAALLKGDLPDDA
jgi:hypothetical protein